MCDFDPESPALLHDSLNDKTFHFIPDMTEHWRKHARFRPDGVVEWDGLLIDNWSPVKK
jgi:hypothetical protein